MIIQRIAFPKGATFEEKLYVRCNRERVAVIGEENIIIANNIFGQIRFDTYFNTFSRKKWNKYTNLEDLGLQIDIQGDARVVLTKLELHGDDIEEYIVSSKVVRNTERETVVIPYPAFSNEDAVTFHVFPLSNEIRLYGGAYISDVDERSFPEVSLALAICTYRREDYIAHNMKILEEGIFSAPDSILRGKIKVYISDNGNTLKAGDFNSKYVSLFPNLNSGGSGGFSRAAIEAMHDSSFKPTNIILMDDDIQFEVDAIERTYTFLRMLKPEYHIHMLGGAMFRSDRRNIQHAAGETYTLNGIIFNKTDSNMNGLRNVLRNEIEERINYLGWWYCVIPTELFEKAQFSLPLFVQFDDIEFSLRNKDVPKITLNGICCWHLPFDKKWSSFKTYYSVRNKSIVNAIYFDNFTKYAFFKSLTMTLIKVLLQYSYNEADLTLLAGEDFLKGMSWLSQQNPAALNDKVIGLSDELMPVESLPEPFDPRALKRNYNWRKKKDLRILRLLILNGWIFPANRNVTVEVNNPPIRYFYRAKKAIKYDIQTGKGIVAKKDYRRAGQILSRWIKLSFETWRRFDKAVDSYRTSRDEVAAEKFWRDVLKF